MYIMSSRDLELARQSAKVAKLFGVPLLGLPGSAHQEACKLEGADFIPEWYVDVLYGDEGQLLGPPSAALRDKVTPDVVYKRVCCLFSFCFRCLWTLFSAFDRVDRRAA